MNEFLKDTQGQPLALDKYRQAYAAYDALDEKREHEYQYTRSIWSLPPAIEALSLIESRGKRVLIVGLGVGTEAALFLDRQAVEVVGIDIALPKQCPQGISRHVMDVHHMSFADNSFDIVYCQHTLMFCNRDLAFKEIKRVLRQGGAFISIEVLLDNIYMFMNRKILNRYRETKYVRFSEYISARDIFGEAVLLKGYYLLSPLFFVIKLFRMTRLFYFLAGLESAIFSRIPFLRKYSTFGLAVYRKS